MNSKHEVRQAIAELVHTMEHRRDSFCFPGTICKVRAEILWPRIKLILSSELLRLDAVPLATLFGTLYLFRHAVLSALQGLGCRKANPSALRLQFEIPCLVFK